MARVCGDHNIQEAEEGAWVYQQAISLFSKSTKKVLPMVANELQDFF